MADSPSEARTIFESFLEHAASVRAERSGVLTESQMRLLLLLA